MAHEYRAVTSQSPGHSLPTLPGTEVCILETRLPAPEEIAELVAFLPRLYAQGFTPVTGAGGGTVDEDGTLTLPWPEYDELVRDFFHAAGSEWWSDYDYVPEEAGRMLENHEGVKDATLSQIKAMLTYCVRGERFCDGHWAAMIERGHIRRLLERLAVLAAGPAPPRIAADCDQGGP